MWQQLRKQEKAIKGYLVDIRKRAERRKNFYNTIREDPIKFLRCYGRPMKVHVDSETIRAATNPKSMSKWQLDKSVIIDRFDARAHLDHVPETFKETKNKTSFQRLEERLLNYERYRCLVHNKYSGISEHFCLKQIEWDEKFGSSSANTDTSKKKDVEIKKKKLLQDTKAAIGYNYDDENGINQYSDYLNGLLTKKGDTQPGEEGSNESEEADSDMDIDVDIDVYQMSKEQRRELCLSGHSHSIKKSDFVRLLEVDQIIDNEIRLAKAIEEEKCSSRRPRRKHGNRRERHRIRGERGGLIGSQPIKKRVVYLSASSSDSNSYQSPEDSMSDDPTEEERIEYMSNAKPTFVRESRGRICILIGGMTKASFSTSQKLRRHNFDEYDIRTIQVNGDKKKKKKRRRTSGTSSRSSSRSSASSYKRRRRDRGHSSSSGSSYRRANRKQKIEYITTFGDSDGEKKKSSNSRSSNKHSRSYDNSKSNGKLKKTSSSSSLESVRKPEPAVPIKRYYRAELEKESDSLSYDSDASKSDNKHLKKNKRNKGNTHRSKSDKDSSLQPQKVTPGTRFTPQELMRKRLQMQLNNTHKADKEEEERKKMRLREEKIYRDRELREVALKQQGERKDAPRKVSISSSSSSSSSSSYHGHRKNQRFRRNRRSSSSKSSSRSSSAKRSSRRRSSRSSSQHHRKRKSRR